MVRDDLAAGRAALGGGVAVNSGVHLIRPRLKWGRSALPVLGGAPGDEAGSTPPPLCLHSPVAKAPMSWGARTPQAAGAAPPQHGAFRRLARPADRGAGARPRSRAARRAAGARPARPFAAASADADR